MTANEVFTAFVHVADATGENHPFSPGDPVPGWATNLVGDHVKAQSTEYTPEVEPVDGFVEDDAHVSNLLAVMGEDGADAPPAHPPTSGPGSGRHEWAQWARKVGMVVPMEYSRQQIMDSAIRHGHLVE